MSTRRSFLHFVHQCRVTPHLICRGLGQFCTIIRVSSGRMPLKWKWKNILTQAGPSAQRSQRGRWFFVTMQIQPAHYGTVHKCSLFWAFLALAFLISANHFTHAHVQIPVRHRHNIERLGFPGRAFNRAFNDGGVQKSNDARSLIFIILSHYRVTVSAPSDDRRISCKLCCRGFKKKLENSIPGFLISPFTAP